MPTDLPCLIVAASERSADMFYATRFFVPDAFVFLRHRDKTIAMLSDLEIDRARRTAAVDEIVAYSVIADRLPQKSRAPFADVVAEFLRTRKIKRALVPGDFPLGLAQSLAKAGVKLVPRDGLFWREREFKNEDELRKLRRALAITECGMARAMEVLRASIIDGKKLRWSQRVLTSEILRAEIESTILRAGGVPANTIVAGGGQACDPHERGHGPLRAHELIIIDIFPRDADSGYYGDLTRTVVRGRASEAQRQLWTTVQAGQRLALKAMKPRVSGRKVHEAIKKLFADSGYPTEQRDGRWIGFFHGTGHGLGLDIHEEPRFAKTHFKPGQVLTVEPGIYWPGIGGARLEDVVTITGSGMRKLSRFPQTLEL